MLRSRRPARRIAAAMALAAMLAACGGGDEPLSDPLLIETPQEGVTDRTMKARLTMTVTGAQTLELETETALKIYEIYGDALPQETQFVSISAGQPVETPDGQVLLFTADLAPGLYRGPGTYTLDPKEKARSGDVTSPLSSAAYLQISAADGSQGWRYEEIVEPCTLRVSAGQRTGRVECDALADGSGDTISLRWSWELI